MRFVLLILAFIVSVTATAGAYRWVDAQGKVHYGDRPPAGAERLKAPPPPARSHEAAAKDIPDATPEPGNGVYAGSSYTDICNELKARLARYHSAPQMAVLADDGQPRNLSPKERDEMINSTQTQADQACARAADE